MYYNRKGGVIISIENLDEIIKKYTESLVNMGQLYGGEAPKDDLTPPKTKNESIKEETATSSGEEEKPLISAETEKNEGENTASDITVEDVNTEPAVSPPAVDFPEGEATSFAPFVAAVFSGEEAYPVEGARVVVYRGDNIYAFLTTDENGRTDRARLPAFPEGNSLESDNPDRSIDYSADVFAEGFITKKGLLVSAVGGSDILLKVIMIPEGERIS